MAPGSLQTTDASGVTMATSAEETAEEVLPSVVGETDSSSITEDINQNNNDGRWDYDS